MDLLIRQMVNSISEHDGLVAIENALQWLRQECRCERAMFYQFKGPSLLTFAASNVPQAGIDYFRGERSLAEDPIIRSYRNELGFLDWFEAFRQYPASAEYQQVAQNLGLLPAQSYGYTSHCARSVGVISVCTLAGLQRNLGSEDKYLLSSLIPVLHMVGRGTRLRSHGLTERELEILSWAREGKTTAEIAHVREVSESTIKYHFKAIYSKLGVANRAQAVGEALCRGLIY